MDFVNWELRPELIEGLAQQGITTPTPVQEQAWPLVQAGHDLLVQSRTGTGKTLAFGLPILQALEPGAGPVEALIVLPTRELALQVANALGRLGAPLAVLYGGGAYSEQLRALRCGARIVVGTPGRLCDHVERGSLDLSKCKTLVLDEADEILDLGFAEELDKLLAALPAERQSLLFSATLAPDMKALAAKTLRNPQTLAVSSGLTAAPEIRHVAYEVHRELRTDALTNVLHVERPNLAIVFCHTRAETEELAERLRSDGFSAQALHGDMAQNERTRTLNAFRRRQVRILVATDVAARGIDVRGVTHVFNLAVPNSAETYIHRTGRTGRAGEKGMAVTFVPLRDGFKFRRMLHLSKVEIEVKPLPQAEDVRKRLREAYHQTQIDRLANGVDTSYRVLAEELLAYMDPVDAVSALMAGDAEALACMQAGLDVPVPRARPMMVTQRPGGPAAGPRVMPGPRMATKQVQVSLGKRDRMAVGPLVRLLRDVSGLRADALGAIRMGTHSTTVEVREGDAERLAHVLEGHLFNGNALKARVLAPVGRPQYQKARRGA